MRRGAEVRVAEGRRIEVDLLLHVGPIGDELGAQLGTGEAQPTLERARPLRDEIRAREGERSAVRRRERTGIEALIGGRRLESARRLDERGHTPSEIERRAGARRPGLLAHRRARLRAVLDPVPASAGRQPEACAERERAGGEQRQAFAPDARGGVLVTGRPLLVDRPVSGAHPLAGGVETEMELPVVVQPEIGIETEREDFGRGIAPLAVCEFRCQQQRADRLPLPPVAGERRAPRQLAAGFEPEAGAGAAAPVAIESEAGVRAARVGGEQFLPNRAGFFAIAAGPAEVEPPDPLAGRQVGGDLDAALVVHRVLSPAVGFGAARQQAQRRAFTSQPGHEIGRPALEAAGGERRRAELAVRRPAPGHHLDHSAERGVAVERRRRPAQRLDPLDVQRAHAAPVRQARSPASATPCRRPAAAGTRPHRRRRSRVRSTIGVRHPSVAEED